MERARPPEREPIVVRPVPRSNYRRWLYALVVLLTVIAALYLSGWIYKVAQTGSDVVALYFFAWLFQFFFTPVVDSLCARGLPRVLAVSAVYVALGVATAVILALTLPGMYNQGERLVTQLSNPRTYAVFSSSTRGIETVLESRLHIPKSEIQKFTENYSVSLQHGAVRAGKTLQQIISSHLTPGNLSNSASAFLDLLGLLNTLLLNIVIVLILAFYMMLDGHTLVRQALAYFPPAVDEVMESVHQTINRKFGGYLRGQVLLAVSYGLLTYIIDVGFGLNYALLVAIVCALLMLIPFIGAFASVAPPLVVFALGHLTDPSFPLLRFALLFVFLAVAQHVVMNLLAPRVMSSAMGMHPLLVMLGLLLGAKLAGLWGAIFGVPVLGVLMETVDHIYRRVMEHRYGFHPPDELHPGGNGGRTRRLSLRSQAPRAKSAGPGRRAGFHLAPSRPVRLHATSAALPRGPMPSVTSGETSHVVESHPTERAQDQGPLPARQPRSMRRAVGALGCSLAAFVGLRRR